MILLTSLLNKYPMNQLSRYQIVYMFLESSILLCRQCQRSQHIPSTIIRWLKHGWQFWYPLIGLVPLDTQLQVSVIVSSLYAAV